MPINTDLGHLARQAMLQRGLLPEFSAAVLEETAAIATAAVGTDPRRGDTDGDGLPSVDARDEPARAPLEPARTPAARVDRAVHAASRKSPDIANRPSVDPVAACGAK